MITDYKFWILAFILPPIFRFFEKIFKVNRRVSKIEKKVKMGSGITGAGNFKQTQKTKSGFKKWIRVKLKLDPPQNTYQYRDKDKFIQTNNYDEARLIMDHLKILEDYKNFQKGRHK